MKILVDENIPLMTVRALRDAGHDVVDIRGSENAGMSDEALWGEAQRQKALLITTDKGFARRRAEAHQGLLVVRLRLPNRMKIHSRVVRAMAQVQPEEWAGLLLVVRDEAQSAWRVS